MKANELTDGIYVYFNCFDGSKIIVKVTGFKDGVVYGVSEMGSHWCTIEKVEPIPLTPEILKKLGFAQSTSFKNVYRLILNDEYSVSINMGNVLYLNITKIADDGTEEDNYNIPRPKFVHGLQNAFRLCGINKEIEL